ncbi:unnamed protein product [Protopolystoma xenopodis]|uniref:Uncharacterized protein n=1 Tax=Protopolystoma xenopodis TaxID=117903 RepID=A0A3S5C0L3_9PLAT|nr:unnamed protein product [Protopolystoma xenopodis]
MIIPISTACRSSLLQVFPPKNPSLWACSSTGRGITAITRLHETVTYVPFDAKFHGSSPAVSEDEARRNMLSWRTEDQALYWLQDYP